MKRAIPLTLAIVAVLALASSAEAGGFRPVFRQQVVVRRQAVVVNHGFHRHVDRVVVAPVFLAGAAIVQPVQAFFQVGAFAVQAAPIVVGGAPLVQTQTVDLSAERERLQLLTEQNRQLQLRQQLTMPRTP